MSVHVGKRRTSLGARCDGDLGIVTPTPEGCALLDQSFLAQLTGHKITGNGIRQAVGHVEGRCLFRRPFLSVFYRPYKFISKMGERSCSVSGLTGCPDFGSALELHRQVRWATLREAQKNQLENTPSDAVINRAHSSPL